mmetsp:Transcript_4155/g.11888  ORF Transcript_4155/g.11888 Transcript_4155/m.11888 type:complete len:245 (-) Transcript_4155:445-1179(-)
MTTKTRMRANPTDAAMRALVAAHLVVAAVEAEVVEAAAVAAMTITHTWTIPTVAVGQRTTQDPSALEVRHRADRVNHSSDVATIVVGQVVVVVLVAAVETVPRDPTPAAATAHPPPAVGVGAVASVCQAKSTCLETNSKTRPTRMPPTTPSTSRTAASSIRTESKACTLVTCQDPPACRMAEAVWSTNAPDAGTKVTGAMADGPDSDACRTAMATSTKAASATITSTAAALCASQTVASLRVNT